MQTNIRDELRELVLSFVALFTKEKWSIEQIPPTAITMRKQLRKLFSNIIFSQEHALQYLRLGGSIYEINIFRHQCNMVYPNHRHFKFPIAALDNFKLIEINYKNNNY